MAYNYEFPYTDPNLYNDDWLLKNIKDILDTLDQLNTWKDDHEDEYLQLKALYDDILAGKFPPTVQAAFNKWMSLNAYGLIGEMVKMVFFGLTDDGHFIAYIPDSWDEIQFNTTYYDIVLTAHPEYRYGHLVLSY